MGLVGPVTSINCSQLISELLTHHCIYINDSNNILRNKIDDDDSLLRCTPSFTIIGTMKSGTGELMNWLNLHPLMQSGKGVDGRREVHFFGSPNFDKSTCPLLDYICHFSISNKVLANAKAVQLELNTFHEEASSFALRFDLEVKSKPSNDLSIFTFDKSPNYIRESIALTQIAKTVPNAKLLVLLRDPADRAYSEFRHHCLRGRYRRLTESVTILSCPKLSMHSFTISEFNGLVHEGERSHKTRRNHSSSDSVLHFLSGSVVNKEILECYVAKGNPVDLSTEVPIPVEELARLLGPLSRRCSYIDFASYYFGPNHIIASISIENKPIMRGWAWEEYTHGLYFEQIQQVLQWFPATQLLVLSQQQLLRDPLSLLRIVENFIGAPHFDFSVYAQRKGESVSRRPITNTWTGWAQLYYRKLIKFLGRSSNDGNHLNEDEQRAKSWLRNLYKPHNKKLMKLLHQVYNMSSPLF